MLLFGIGLFFAGLTTAVLPYAIQTDPPGQSVDSVVEFVQDEAAEIYDDGGNETMVEDQLWGDSWQVRGEIILSQNAADLQFGHWGQVLFLSHLVDQGGTLDDCFAPVDGCIPVWSETLPLENETRLWKVTFEKRENSCQYNGTTTVECSPRPAFWLDLLTEDDDSVGRTILLVGGGSVGLLGGILFLIGLLGKSRPPAPSAPAVSVEQAVQEMLHQNEPPRF